MSVASLLPIALLAWSPLQEGISAKALPVIPKGLNHAYVAAASQVEKSLESGDFDSAVENSALLPKAKIRYSWDDASVPEARRAAVKAARDKAFETWKKGVAVEFVQAEPADIGFTFVEGLDKAAATHTIGTDLPNARVKTMIALQRPDPLTDAEVHNEVAYAISQYLGLEPSSQVVALSGRSEQPEAKTDEGTEAEFALAKEALQIASRLRSLTAQSEAVPSGVPQLQLEFTKLDGLSGVQTKPMSFDIKVANKGGAPLALYVKPDCGCFSPTSPDKLAPGQQSVINANVDTVNYVGHLTHYLMVYSNDPEQPFVEIPVTLYVEFLYRFVQPDTSTALVTDKGADAEVFLLLSPKVEKLAIKNVQTAGPTATVKYTPWEGEMGDLVIGEPVQHRKGYAFKVHVDPKGVKGRAPLTVDVQTDNDQFPSIRKTVFFQRGIVAEPSQLYMGELSAQPKMFSFVLDKAGHDFKILKVESGHPSLTVTYKQLKETAKYRFEVQYDGKAIGELKSAIKIETDDSEQPVITIPVQGYIKR